MPPKITTGVTASLLLALAQALPAHGQAPVQATPQPVNYYPANELRGIPGLIYDPPTDAISPAVQGIPGATAPGNIISPIPGESRAWKTGAPFSDVVKFRDLNPKDNPQLAGFTKLSLRDLNKNFGSDIGGVPLKDVELLNGLNLEQLKGVYNNGDIKIKNSLPVVQALLGVVFDPKGAQQQLKRNALSTAKKALINRLNKEKALKDVPFNEILNGDWRGTITAGEALLLNELKGEVPEYLQRLPVGSITIAVIEGDFKAARQQGQNYAIGEIRELTLNEALDKFPELQKIPIGSIAAIANQPLDQSLPQIADLALENIPGVKDKFLSAIPGLGDSPAGAVLTDVIGAFLAGDIFAKFDILHSGQDGPEEFFGRALSGGTPDNKFKRIPGIHSTDSKTKNPKKGFARWEMMPAVGSVAGALLGNEPILGLEWMGRDQEVPGCKGILCVFGKWEPAGIKPVKSAPVKFSLGELEENPNGPSTSRVWVDFQRCITIFFTQHCTAHIISFKTPWKIQNGSLFPVLAKRRIQDYFPGVDTTNRTVNFCQAPTFLGQSQAGSPASNSGNPPDSKYGHLAYAETATDNLFNVSSVAGVQVGLHKDAATAFEQLVQDAQAQGLDIKAVSGFRSVALQKEIWDGKTATTDPSIVAKTSAPPGHSEHHTGYAVDVGNNANASLNESWANTAEYKWMQANAGKYGFEESFPQGNAQGVSFEPWHWRFTGSDAAKQTFQAARQPAVSAPTQVASNSGSLPSPSQFASATGQAPVLSGIPGQPGSVGTAPNTKAASNSGSLPSPSQFASATGQAPALSGTPGQQSSVGAANSNASPSQGRAAQTVGNSAWGSSADIHNLIATSALESTGLQNQVDVAVSIMNRVTSPSHPDSITAVLYQSGQYEPNFGFSPVTTKEEAIARIARKTGSVSGAIREYEQLEAALNNANAIRQSQIFLGGATDFRGQSLLENMKIGDPFRGNKGANFFLRESRDPAVAIEALGALGVKTSAADVAAIQAAAKSYARQTAVNCDPNTLLASSQHVPTGIIQPEGNGIATGKFINPTPGHPVTSRYGPRPLGWHSGIDVGLPVGSPVNASDGGIVEEIGFQAGGYGNYVVVNHKNGYSTLYAHLSEAQVKVGQKVTQDTPIALSGNTGRSTGPHLHYEIVKTVNGVTPRKGNTVDPDHFGVFN